MIGYALATALAAPVEDGMMLAEAARPARQSPFIEPSTVSCDAVAAWTVVIRPCLIPHFSFSVFTSGARPLVVHDAHETTAIDESYSSWLTPATSHVPEKRPWTVSCSRRYFMYSGAIGELMC